MSTNQAPTSSRTTGALPFFHNGVPLRKKGRKKVLFVITKSNFGGAQRYVYDLATSLPKDQYDVAVAFGGTGIAGSDVGTLANTLAEKGVRTIHVPEMGRDVGLADIAALRALITLFKHEKPGVVHLNSSKAAGLGSIAARITGIPRIVFTAHGWPFWEQRHVLSRTARFFFSYLTVLFSHATICISEYDRRAITRMPFIRGKVHMIHNGTSSVDFLSREDARSALFSNADIESHANDLWVLSIGELTDNKNYFVALDAIAAHNTTASQKIFYCIMGDGEQRTRIETYISEKKLIDQVKLLGFVSNGRTYLKGFDILLLPSKKEGLPYVIFEAGLAEVPVVASKVGGIPEVITDGKSGILVDPRDTASMTQALARMASQTEDRPLPAGKQGFAAALKEKIERDFSLNSMLEQTKSLY